MLSICGQVLLTTGGEAVNADNELLLEAASFVPQKKLVVNIGVREGIISYFFYPVSEVYIFSQSTREMLKDNSTMDKTKA